MDSHVPKRLKEGRLDAKMSQKKLGIAKVIDKFSAIAKVNHYEIGRYHPDYSTLKQIDDVLKVPSTYFYVDDDSLAELIKFVGNIDKQGRTELPEKVNPFFVQKDWFISMSNGNGINF